MPETGFSTSALMALIGLIAGFIDSIAGGGGLITLPAVMIAVGAGPSAIATNKIAGTAAAFLAMIVYSRHSKWEWRGARFVLFTGLGAIAGTRVSSHLPAAAFPVLMAVSLPILLWVAFRKDHWIRAEHGRPSRSEVGLLACGALTGFYDGAWGPGGGTLMLLSLIWIAGTPLRQALFWSKVANTVSASFALLGFVILSPEVPVYWNTGFALAAGCSVGALIGARLAVKQASRVVRPVLVVVALLLSARAIGLGASERSGPDRPAVSGTP